MIAKARVVPLPGGNATERAYAERLRLLQLGGEVAKFWFEALKLQIGSRCWYTPDFLVQLPTGELQLHEVKGFMRDDALVKLKAVAAQFPYKLIVVRKIKGAWQFEHIKPVC